MKRYSVRAFAATACMLLATNAYAGRVPLHKVAIGSPECAAIVEAEYDWMVQNPNVGPGITLTPLLIKRNDRRAYLTAIITGAPKVPYIEAVLQLKGGHWVSTGLMAENSHPNGSVEQMCRYGDGIHHDVFRECK